MDHDEQLPVLKLISDASSGQFDHHTPRQIILRLASRRAQLVWPCSYFLVLSSPIRYIQELLLIAFDTFSLRNVSCRKSRREINNIRKITDSETLELGFAPDATETLVYSLKTHQAESYHGPITAVVYSIFFTHIPIVLIWTYKKRVNGALLRVPWKASQQTQQPNRNSLHIFSRLISLELHSLVERPLHSVAYFERRNRKLEEKKWLIVRRRQSGRRIF